MSPDVCDVLPLWRRQLQYYVSEYSFVPVVEVVTTVVLSL